MSTKIKKKAFSFKRIKQQKLFDFSLYNNIKFSKNLLTFLFKHLLRLKTANILKFIFHNKIISTRLNKLRIINHTSFVIFGSGTETFLE